MNHQNPHPNHTTCCYPCLVCCTYGGSDSLLSRTTPFTYDVVGRLRPFSDPASSVTTCGPSSGDAPPS